MRWFRIRSAWMGGGLVVLAAAVAGLWFLAHANPKVERNEADATLIEAVRLMKQEAKMGGQLKWEVPLARARAQAARTGRLWDLEAALGALTAELTALDGHSHYVPAAHVKQMQAHASTTQEGREHLVVRQPDVEGIPRLHMSGWSVLNEARNAAAVAEAARLLQAALQDQPCGLVLDLRDNIGGNMYPMLQAIAALLPPGELGYFESGKGKRMPWPVPARSNPAANVAIGVLMGPNTASSGEFVLIALRSAPHVRFFGAASYGVPTGNAVYPLPHGGALALMVSTTLDRHGRPVQGRVAPDVDSADPAPLAARWVRQHCPMGERVSS